MTTLVGLDVGHDGRQGARALAGRRGARPGRGGLRLSTPQPGWAEQDPELWWRATQAALAELAAEDVAGIGLSGQMHGLVAPRRRGARPPAGDPLERPAHGAGVRPRSRSELGLDAPRRADREPRPRRLHGARSSSGCARHEPEVYERIAHVLLPKDYVRLRLTGERAIDAGGRLGHAPPRRGARGAGATRCSPRSRSRPSGCRRCSSRRRSPGRPRGRAGGRRRGRPGGGRARRRRRPARARSRSCSEPPGSSSPRCPGSRPTRRAAARRSATPCPAPGTRWA